MEGSPHTCREPAVLLPGLSRAGGPAARRPVADLYDPGRSGIHHTVFVRCLWRLGLGGIRWAQYTPSQSHWAAHAKRKPIRGYCRRQGLPVGNQGNYGDLQAGPNRARFSAGSSGRCQSLAHLPGHRQPGLCPLGREPPAPRELPPGCRGRDVGRSLPEGHLLLPERQRRRRATRAPGTRSTPGNARFYVLDAGMGGSQRRYRNAVLRRLPHALDTSAPSTVAQGRPPRAPVGPQVRVLALPDVLRPTDESSDTSLRGNASLEGLLASNGVNLAVQRARATSTSATRRRPATVVRAS